jgi:surface antigen
MVPMMKKHILILLASLCLTAGPALAQQGTERDEPETPFTKENIGKAVGAAAGALLGTQIGSGRGKLAAVAIGTLAGYWVGGRIGRELTERDQAGIAYTTHEALESGQTQTWQNPDTGVSTRVSVRDAGAGGEHTGLDPLGQAPTLELINGYFIADANINVRGGPGTDYVILYRLARNERVPVIGRVVDTEWLMIAQQGAGNGFVYGPLLSASNESDNAIRDVMRTGETFATYDAESRECRIITQEVVMPDDRTQVHEFKACRQADGTWMEV